MIYPFWRHNWTATASTHSDRHAVVRPKFLERQCVPHACSCMSIKTATFPSMLRPCPETFSERSCLFPALCNTSLAKTFRTAGDMEGKEGGGGSVVLCVVWWWQGGDGEWGLQRTSLANNNGAISVHNGFAGKRHRQHAKRKTRPAPTHLTERSSSSKGLRTREACKHLPDSASQAPAVASSAETTSSRTLSEI